MSSSSSSVNCFTFVFIVHYLVFSVFLRSIDGVVSNTDFDFGTMTLTSLKLLGDAHLNNGSVRLTLDLPVPNSGAGRILYSQPIKFRHPETRSPASFASFFSFSITNLNPSSIGGGLAFVITSDDASVGDPGGSLGLMYQSDPVSTPAKFVAVEFDTLMDVEFKDINGNHVGLDLNSVVSSHVADMDAAEIDLKSGDLINSWVEYDGPTRVLKVSISYSNVKPKVPNLSVEFDLEEYVNDFMFVGFSGSTQGSTEVHSIEWWSFSSSFDSGSISSSASMISSPNPLNANANAPSGLLSNSSSGANDTKVSDTRPNNESSSSSTGAVLGVVTAGACVLALFTGGLFWVYKKKFKHVMMEKPEILGSNVFCRPREFSYRELKSATKGFNSDRVIGHGAFGTVYRGVLPETGDVVAIKKCSHNTQGKTEFMAELSIIGTLRHRNLVRLEGWCYEKGEILLVYDLLVNGSLDKALFESRMVLPWHHRRKILMGIASALTYLHQECENQVIHRDVKTSNVMLDEGFNAKLGDFGLAKQIEHDRTPDATVAAGTMGYLAPEYLLTGRATEKTDVFSYGAVVLEVASGRRPIDKETIGNNLVDWVWSLYREGRLVKAADTRLGGEFDEAEMGRVLLIGLACSHPDPLARPTMRAVAQMLVGESEVPIVPRTKPSLSFSTSHLILSLQDSLSDCNGEMITRSSSSSEGINSGPEYLV